MKPQIVAHRGASAKKKENTLPAFALAAEIGADWVELDVRQTSDGVLAVHHDAHLADDHTKSIADLHSSDLPDHIPTLAEALEVCAGVGVVVEIKNHPQEPGYDSEHMISAAVAGTLQGYAQQRMVISFNLASINRIRAEDPSLMTGYLVFDPMIAAQSIDLATEAGHALVSYHTSCITPSLVDQAHGSGLKVHTWTVNDPEQMESLMLAGVDGIVTDCPDVAIKVREKLGLGED